MGVSISLLFVRERDLAATLDQLKLATTHDHRSTPLIQRGAFVAATLPSGYNLIWSNTCDERRFSADVLSNLSAGGEVVVLAVEEHVMFSRAEVWREGRQLWSLEHEGDVDAANLSPSGDMPSLFARLRQEQEALGIDHQDFFDIPVKLVADMTGYRYDQNYDWEAVGAYTVLIATVSPMRSFWKFW